MAHLYKAEEWQSASGSWYCNDVQELNAKKSIASFWWAPVRLLNITTDEYVKMLIDDFKVDKISYNEDKDVLTFSWLKQSDMRKYKNWINKKAREKQFIC